MSQKDFITDADTALANLVWDALQKVSVAKNIAISQEQVLFSSPKSADKTRKLSIFLYNITEEKTARNVPPTVDSKEKTPPHTFALRYLISAFTGNDKDDHALLEAIINTLLVTPSTGDTTGTKTAEFTLKVDSLSPVELSRLWIAMGTPLKISVGITVYTGHPSRDSELQSLTQVTNGTTAPQTAVPYTKNVDVLYQTVLKTFTEQSDGWKNRNIVFRQWVFQNFKKITNMSVEEMQISLNSLGDKLARHESADQFIKPLNQLNAYYKQQLDQLKGMQRVSRNQGDNLDTVKAWISEVGALLEALNR